MKTPKTLIILSLLVWFFTLQNCYSVPAKDSYRLDICWMIINTDAIKGYKIVTISEFWAGAREIENYECLNWFLFLVPENLKDEDIKTRKIEREVPKEENTSGLLKNHTLYNYSFSLDAQQNNRYWWTNFKWELENEDTKFLWKIKNECYNVDERNHCNHPNTFPSRTDFHVLSYNKDGEPTIKRVFSLPYNPDTIVTVWLVIICVLVLLWVFIRHRIVNRHKREPWLIETKEKFEY